LPKLETLSHNLETPGFKCPDNPCTISCWDDFYRS